MRQDTGWKNKVEEWFLFAHLKSKSTFKTRFKSFVVSKIACSLRNALRDALQNSEIDYSRTVTCVSTFDHGRRDARPRSAYSIAESSDFTENFSIDLANNFFFFFLLFSYYFFFRNITLTVSWKPWKDRKRKVGSKGEGRVGKIHKNHRVFHMFPIRWIPHASQLSFVIVRGLTTRREGGLVQLHRQQVAWKNDPYFFALLHL